MEERRAFEEIECTNAMTVSRIGAPQAIGNFLIGQNIVLDGGSLLGLVSSMLSASRFMAQ